jgi:hypothetical protein
MVNVIQYTDNKREKCNGNALHRKSWLYAQGLGQLSLLVEFRRRTFFELAVYTYANNVNLRQIFQIWRPDLTSEYISHYAVQSVS